jgi:uncharacterized membrane-anchored protein
MKSSPEDLQLRALTGLILAYVGRAAEARAMLARALGSGLVTPTNEGYFHLLAARAEVALGDAEKAVGDHLEEMQRIGYFL